MKISEVYLIVTISYFYFTLGAADLGMLLKGYVPRLVTSERSPPPPLPLTNLNFDMFSKSHV